MSAMPETAREWHDRVLRQAEADGYGDAGWPSSPSYPLDPDGAVRRLDPPGDERPREGAGGVDCPLCLHSTADDPRDYVYWRDDLCMLGVPFQPTALPLATFLMPRRHADLSDLTHGESRRMGEVLVHLERAAVDVLDVPRVQVTRFGEGVEHLHWWVFARPAGTNQLRGSFLLLWDDVLPPRDLPARRADLDLVAARLVELAGGEALPSR
jgi:diadenosine tetraphosphate (Ap4A) HIT family hydrolase